MSEDNHLDQRIKTLFERVFSVSPELISDKTRRGDFERWDSLGHLELLEGLREEFQVEISPEEALEMETVEDIKRRVKELLEAS